MHRLPPKADKEPLVLVRFVSRVTRDEWMTKKSDLKARKSNVYFLDNLTLENKNILWEIKLRCQEKHYQFAWHRDGKLFVHRAQAKRAIRIACEADLSLIRCLSRSFWAL